jgi:rhamnogalacturonyl hydrolase YesR
MPLAHNPPRWRAGSFLIVLLLLFQIVPSRIRGDVYEPTYTVLKSAERLASYVISRAVYDNGFKWVVKADSKTFYNAVLQNGAAGVGLFLLTLYRVTGNSTYLDYAKGAASWIMASAESRDGGLTWPHYDAEGGWYLTPDKSVSGIAKFFLEMYTTTQDEKFLECAKRATNWIINVGIVCQGDQCYVEYNPYHQAAFGIYSYPQRDVGTLLLELYNITGDRNYLSYAERIGNWVLKTSECYGNYCKWYDDRGYGNVYTVEGIAVLADFLYDLYITTRSEKYKNVADGMVNWIESVGVKTGYTIKFPSYDGRFRSIVWGDWDRPLSIRTIGEIFIKSYEVTGNKTRLVVAEMFENWLENISITVSNGVRAVPYIEGGREFSPWINAIIFNYVIKLYLKEKAQKLLDYALSLLGYIDYFVKEKISDLDPIFYRGASGIGYYLTLTIEMMRESARYTVSIDVRPKVSGIKVDGVQYTPEQIPLSFEWEEGSNHALQVIPAIIDCGNWTRRVFDGWYEGGKLISSELSLTFSVNRSRNLEARWRTQYFVTASTPYSTVEGEGWYSEGVFAEVRLAETEVGGPLVRYVFDGWEGLKPEDRVLGSGVASVYVDGPRVLRAVWRADYSRAYALAFILMAGVVAVGFLVFSRRRGTTVAATAAAMQPPSGEAAQPQPPVEKAATVAAAPFNVLKAELEKYEEYLKRLEDLKAGGRISEQAYQALKSEYEAKVQELKKKLGLASSS